MLLSDDRSSRQRRNTYDVLNRLIKTDYLYDGGYDQYTYNDVGDLVQVGNLRYGYTYTYTARHKLATKVDNRRMAAITKTLSWRYDAVGNVILKSPIGDP